MPIVSIVSVVSLSHASRGMHGLVTDCNAGLASQIGELDWDRERKRLVVRRQAKLAFLVVPPEPDTTVASNQDCVVVPTRQ